MTASRQGRSEFFSLFKISFPWNFQRYMTQPHFLLDETHLDAVRGLIGLRDFRASASTSRACRSDAAIFDKDKQIYFIDLNQYGRIQIKVASLSVVSFHNLTVQQIAVLYPISLYIIFLKGRHYITLFLSSFMAAWSYVFGGET